MFYVSWKGEGGSKVNYHARIWTIFVRIIRLESQISMCYMHMDIDRSDAFAFSSFFFLPK